MQTIKITQPLFSSRQLQGIETKLRQIMQQAKRNKTNSKVGKTYCKPGTVCKPIEGSFCTECELCNKFNVVQDMEMSKKLTQVVVAIDYTESTHADKVGFVYCR